MSKVVESDFRVVPESVDISPGLRKGTVTLESSKADELISLDASNIVLETAAANGLLAAAIRNRGSLYPVDKNGNPVTDPTQGFPSGGKFRMDYTIGSTL